MNFLRRFLAASGLCMGFLLGVIGLAMAVVLPDGAIPSRSGKDLLLSLLLVGISGVGWVIFWACWKWRARVEPPSRGPTWVDQAVHSVFLHKYLVLPPVIGLIFSGGSVLLGAKRVLHVVTTGGDDKGVGAACLAGLCLTILGYLGLRISWSIMEAVSTPEKWRVKGDAPWPMVFLRLATAAGRGAGFATYGLGVAGLVAWTLWSEHGPLGIGVAGALMVLGHAGTGACLRWDAMLRSAVTRGDIVDPAKAQAAFAALDFGLLTESARELRGLSDESLRERAESVRDGRFREVLGVSGIVCRACGREAPTRGVEFHSVTGDLLTYRDEESRGGLCRTCIRDIGGASTRHTLLRGWWNPEAFLLSLYALPVHVFHRWRASSLPETQESSVVPTMDAGTVSDLGDLAIEGVRRLGKGGTLRDVAGTISRVARRRPGETALALLAVASGATRRSGSTLHG